MPGQCLDRVPVGGHGVPLGRLGVQFPSPPGQQLAVHGGDHGPVTGDLPLKDGNPFDGRSHAPSLRREALHVLQRLTEGGAGRLPVRQRRARSRERVHHGPVPKPVVAMVAGYAIGGGHVLHLVCDLTIAADNAVFGQTGPRVGSFDGGYGSGLLARVVGQKKAREIWFLCRQYSAPEALAMGLVNTVVPVEALEEETVAWCGQMLQHSPLAMRMLKASLNAADDGLAGIQQLAGDATLLYYLSEEAQEGKRAYLEKRAPDFGRFPRRP